MSLTAGSKLGPYEILAPVGAGGMGSCCPHRHHLAVLFECISSEERLVYKS